MNKHTQGPWNVGHRLSNNKLAIIGDGDSVICEFQDRSGVTFSWDIVLIQAAPDLLRELRHARKFLMQHGIHVPNSINRALLLADGELE